ncbi:MAG: glutamate 5-kinase, partial [Nitrospinota bacterium]|nr:glutamate 5-kinase [Nitrospinota bacterium]
MGHSREQRRQKLLEGARRMVVKVGSGVLTGETYEQVNERVLGQIAGQVAHLAGQGRKVAVVSSGSVALGAKTLGVPRRGLPIPVQQAAAAVGQGSLISLWARSFEKFGYKVGQVLLTHDDMANRRRFLNSRNTINALFDFGVIPIINENDTVAVHEIKFGDNDTLSARVTNLIEADLLAILSDVEGLFTADPRLDKQAEKIAFVERVDEDILAVAGDSSSRTGLGGMASKVRAAEEAARFGASTIILPGDQGDSMKNAMAGAGVGTFFFPHEDPVSSKKHWIEFTLKSQGRIVVDKGAMEAVLKKGKSLLASGVASVEGDFESGEAVDLAGPDGVLFGKGLVNYHSHEMEKIKG